VPRPRRMSRAVLELVRGGEGDGTSTCPDIHGNITAAGSFLNHLVARGVISENPIKRLARGERPKTRNQKQQHIPSPAETDLVVAAAPSLRLRALFTAAAHTAARRNELLAIEWSDISWGDNTVRIEKLDPKGRMIHRMKSDNGVRTVGMSPELRRILREHFVASGQPQQGFVFACASGKPLTPRNASRALNVAIKSAGIEYDADRFRFGFHAFRHAGVSALICSGVDPVRVARFIGDRVETVLSVYAHEWATANDQNLGDVLGNALSAGATS